MQTMVVRPRRPHHRFSCLILHKNWAHLWKFSNRPNLENALNSKGTFFGKFIEFVRFARNLGYRRFRGPEIESCKIEVDICAYWLFCLKFNAQQLLFEPFSNIIGNFGSVEPEIESTFSFQYNVIFGVYQFGGLSSSIFRGDRYVRPLTF